jgi:hypothetical protein
MNENDYMIAEVMVITAGVFTFVTTALFYALFKFPFDVSFFIVASFIGFVTFFFGLYFHMKKRLYIAENLNFIKKHRSDKPREN